MQDLFLKPEILWFIAGFVLLGAELMAPGFIILFFGLGAWGVSLLCFLFDPSLNIQLSVFLGLSIFLLIFLRKKVSSVFSGDKENGCQEEIDDLKGEKAVVSKDIKPGYGGKVFFRGCDWNADSLYEIEKDTPVIIKDRESIKLIVDPLDKKES